MSIGSRIRDLRTARGLTQEYLAEQTGVSRQSVSKWEQDLSRPSTKNLTKLAELFGVSVEDLTIPVHKPRWHRLSRQAVLRLAGVLLTIAAASSALYVHTRPVSWDAGACTGGYAAAMFQKYGDALAQRFAATSGGHPEDITSVEALPGTASADWEGRTLFLTFQLCYESRSLGTVTETVTYAGTRIWSDTYRWGGAAVRG